jgi:predicted phosphatase
MKKNFDSMFKPYRSSGFVLGVSMYPVQSILITSLFAQKLTGIYHWVVIKIRNHNERVYSLMIYRQYRQDTGSQRNQKDILQE